MKKNGFISTSIIYTFFIVFLLLMLLLLNSYSSNRFLMEKYKNDIRNSFAEASLADINLFIMAWDESTQDYEQLEYIPTIGYYYESNYSYCVKGGTIDYNGADILVSTKGKDTCYAYFREAESDINIKVYTKESNAAEEKLVKTIPGANYKITSMSCNNNGKITFDENTREFTVNTTDITECKVVFTKKNADVRINIYKQNAYGSHMHENLRYVKVEEIPGINYAFADYKCAGSNTKTEILYENDELVIITSGKNECDVYFNGGSSNVELIIMMETDTGVSGYTTGIKYTKIATIPGSGYKYVGYICNDDAADVVFDNGIFHVSSSTQTTCRAYFNEYSGGVKINYYLETSDNKYESVTEIPKIGYVYNSGKSRCERGSTINVKNNLITIDASTEDVCNIYFDLATADINVQVYVMNRETNKYEISRVPLVGYQLYNAGCTNGATIDYKNGILTVNSDSPTVCTVYFR